MTRRPARMRALAVAAVIIAAGSACQSSDDLTARSSQPTSTATVRPTSPPTIAAAPSPEPAPPLESVAPSPEQGPTALVADPVRHPAAARTIYFVLPDRFENGDASNDRAGIAGDQLQHGFDPTHKAWHHGGDLAGLVERLDYIEGLGVGAIWITPPFTNRFVQGDGTVAGSSSSYHGYWQIDWSAVDPHLGTDDDMRAFIDEAHRRGIAVYFDVVVNHTGDIITYAEDSTVYQSMSASPYLDAAGNDFDVAEVAGSDAFPALDASLSFAYTPAFRTVDDQSAKWPEWLNDPTLYHNRGDSTFRGESSIHGDFYGLDDLFTEHPTVVNGMIDLHGDLIERFDIDGFRVDTMKHVNVEFWDAFLPAIRERADALGKSDFLIFGEVFNTDPIVHSTYTGSGADATLDFIVADAIERYVTGSPADVLSDAFDDDDWFTDADSNASMQVTFVGNHDMGRLGYLVDRALPGASDDELVARVELAMTLLHVVRGSPVIYYGDEQGFVGDGGDQDARQDMFASQTDSYRDDDQLGTDATPGADNFDEAHRLYRHIAELTALRRDHPVFADGAQVVHPSEPSAFVLSRLDRSEQIEHLVIANNDLADVTLQVMSLTAGASFDSIWGEPTPVESDATGLVTVTVPPLAVIVLRADRPVDVEPEPVEIDIVRPGPGTTIPTTRYRVQAELADDRWAEVTFSVSVEGGPPELIGVDDAAPYRVYWSNGHLPSGTQVELIAAVTDDPAESAPSSRVIATSVRAVLGER